MRSSITIPIWYILTNPTVSLLNAGGYKMYFRKQPLGHEKLSLQKAVWCCGPFGHCQANTKIKHELKIKWANHDKQAKIQANLLHSDAKILYFKLMNTSNILKSSKLSLELYYNLQVKHMSYIIQGGSTLKSYPFFLHKINSYLPTKPKQKGFWYTNYKKNLILWSMAPAVHLNHKPKFSMHWKKKSKRVKKISS